MARRSSTSSRFSSASTIQGLNRRFETRARRESGRIGSGPELSGSRSFRDAQFRIAFLALGTDEILLHFLILSFDCPLETYCLAVAARIAGGEVTAIELPDHLAAAELVV